VVVKGLNLMQMSHRNIYRSVALIAVTCVLPVASCPTPGHAETTVQSGKSLAQKALPLSVPAHAERLQFSPEITDYTEAITAALERLAEQGGGTLFIPYGKYPLLNQVALNTGKKEISIIIRGEKGPRGELPVFFSTDVSRPPHTFFFFQSDMLTPSLSIAMADLEIRGNNTVPVDFSKGNVKFVLDVGETDVEPNKNLTGEQTYGHPHFYRPYYCNGVLARNMKTFHADGLVIRDLFGNGFQLANYGNANWDPVNRMQGPTIRNCKILNVWQWHEIDTTGDGIMMWSVQDAVVENNQIVNDLAVTRWIGRCGVVLENLTEDCVIRNNTISGYSRNIHIENTFGGHKITGNKLLASDNGVTLNEPDGRPATAMSQTLPVLIADNIMEYSQERERYNIHPFGGQRSFVSITVVRSAALNGTQVLNNRMTYRLHKGIKPNPWRAYDVTHKTRHIYINNTAGVKDWIEKGNVFK
jgi:hypothetical protein